MNTILIQKVVVDDKEEKEESKAEELHIEDMADQTPEQETPKMAKRKYDSSEQPANLDEKTPKN